MAQLQLFVVMLLMLVVTGRHFVSKRPRCYQPGPRKRDFGVKCVLGYCKYVLAEGCRQLSEALYLSLFS